MTPGPKEVTRNAITFLHRRRLLVVLSVWNLQDELCGNGEALKRRSQLTWLEKRAHTHEHASLHMHALSPAMLMSA